VAVNYATLIANKHYIGGKPILAIKSISGCILLRPTIMVRGLMYRILAGGYDRVRINFSL